MCTAPSPPATTSPLPLATIACTPAPAPAAPPPSPPRRILIFNAPSPMSNMLPLVIPRATWPPTRKVKHVTLLLPAKRLLLGLLLPSCVSTWSRRGFTVFLGALREAWKGGCFLLVFRPGGGGHYHSSEPHPQNTRSPDSSPPEESSQSNCYRPRPPQQSNRHCCSPPPLPPPPLPPPAHPAPSAAAPPRGPLRPAGCHPRG